MCSTFDCFPSPSDPPRRDGPFRAAGDIWAVSAPWREVTRWVASPLSVPPITRAHRHLLYIFAAPPHPFLGVRWGYYLNIIANEKPVIVCVCVVFVCPCVCILYIKSLPALLNWMYLLSCLFLNPDHGYFQGYLFGESKWYWTDQTKWRPVILKDT